MGLSRALLLFTSDWELFSVPSHTQPLAWQMGGIHAVLTALEKLNLPVPLATIGLRTAHTILASLREGQLEIGVLARLAAVVMRVVNSPLGRRAHSGATPSRHKHARNVNTTGSAMGMHTANAASGTSGANAFASVLQSALRFLLQRMVEPKRFDSSSGTGTNAVTTVISLCLHVLRTESNIIDAEHSNDASGGSEGTNGSSSSSSSSSSISNSGKTNMDMVVEALVCLVGGATGEKCARRIAVAGGATLLKLVRLHAIRVASFESSNKSNEHSRVLQLVLRLVVELVQDKRETSGSGALTSSHSKVREILCKQEAVAVLLNAQALVAGAGVGGVAKLRRLSSMATDQQNGAASASASASRQPSASAFASSGVLVSTGNRKMAVNTGIVVALGTCLQCLLTAR